MCVRQPECCCHTASCHAPTHTPVARITHRCHPPVAFVTLAQRVPCSEEALAAFNPGDRGWVIASDNLPGEVLSFVAAADAAHFKGVKVGGWGDAWCHCSAFSLTFIKLVHNLWATMPRQCFGCVLAVKQ